MSMRIKAPAKERYRYGRRLRAGCLCVLAASAWAVAPARAQAPDPPITQSHAPNSELALDSLIALALEANPRVHAARAQIDAARARIAPAGALPDPMLGIGVMNLPLAEPGFRDDMTLKTIAIGQQLPFPGKLALARRVAEHELRAADARFEAAHIEVVDAAIEYGAVERVRPKVMTVTAITAGLLPILWGHGAGADVMKRIAAPMVGGMCRRRS